MIKSDELADMLDIGGDNGLVISPEPNLSDLRKAGAASIDLRLGTWLVTLRQTRTPLLDVGGSEGSDLGEARLTRRYYVRFGESFILHPRHFVLGVTLEWIRIPNNIGGYVVGKSSWGRRGLVIATAVGVHPGFAGCLTLEITNLGEIPIALRPGMQICQLFLHRASGSVAHIDQSSAVGHSRPSLGRVKPDSVALKLRAD